VLLLQQNKVGYKCYLQAPYLLACIYTIKYSLSLAYFNSRNISYICKDLREGIKYTIRDFYVVSTVHLEMKLYNDRRNAQVFNLFIYLLLPYIFLAFFSQSSEAGVQFRQLRQWLKFPGYGVWAQALTPYPGDLTTAEVVHLPPQMG
jgi:hypothetical protein